MLPHSQSSMAVRGNFRSAPVAGSLRFAFRGNAAGSTSDNQTSTWGGGRPRAQPWSCTTADRQPSTRSMMTDADLSMIEAP